MSMDERAAEPPASDAQHLRRRYPRARQRVNSIAAIARLDVVSALPGRPTEGCSQA
jgi:hypothetical protein